MTTNHSRATTAGTRDAWLSSRGRTVGNGRMKIIASAKRRRSTPIAHSTGTIISLARAMFSCDRAADSMAFGSELRRRISL